MLAQETTSHVSAEAFGTLAKLQQLTMEAGLSTNAKQLVFRILNRSIIYCRYDRAALWNLTGTSPRLLGVSGNMNVDKQSPLVDEWRALVSAIPHRSAAAVLSGNSFERHRSTWAGLSTKTNGLSVTWLPIKVDDRTVAGIWLERWNKGRFTDADRAQLEPLALAYAIAWRGVFCKRGPRRALTNSRKRLIGALLLVIFVLALCFVRLPLRIVAPCEVIPEDPVAVAAPLNGVIDEVLARPGRWVDAGEIVAVYDKRIALEEMNVAKEQVRIIESELQRSRVQAFDDPTARSAIALLENRLEQEKIRLRVAAYRVDKLEVVAPAAGTPMLDDPHEWRGRPVQIGQRLMMIADPRRTKLRIWLPVSDNIEFNKERPISVVLASDPRTSRSAQLRYVANHSESNKGGTPSFRAQAEWLDRQLDLKLGLQGTAVLYGEKASLGYWLLRRPLSAVRGYLGV
ncbi:MAG: HlyD family efflux transporter periplasmic adaptor subunit [Phycisphaerales bacterium]|nr:MAG: HlyD family efflux transporter periplasmic adaptor subunit [Phycisphaerales bacterium]